MKWWTTLGIDLLVVLVFATVGRLSHAEGAALLGVVVTAWPFVVALAAATIALLAMHRPAYTLRNGVFVWLGTLVVGMLLRVGTGGGVQPSFVVVAGIFLALTMLGWRLLARRRIARTA
ncbi:DUF3054 domain-containing protein [Micropruina sp.]|uniref:DUF3054 domain-containing protein n=1 Tax=Micropruina sp. TaxID=2737536 RepID=UPI0039E70D12